MCVRASAESGRCARVSDPFLSFLFFFLCHVYYFTYALSGVV